ncbi:MULTISPECIES: gamma subclass chorismate mutase AroQ [Lysobacter]|uniref:Chorismate mutase n=1 Tax=Lysobacter firmicutimachus TaxID=1792846 RepID=A0ABU8D230_9GAMM|nr:gamma subclass chorismate mutase AroQ [Lysobacter antibioticus]
MRIERGARLAAWLLAGLLSSALPATAQTPSALERLADLSAQRLRLADQVAASKRRSGRPVEDAAREREQLERLGQAAVARGLPHEAATGFFRAQFEANKLVQYRLLGEPPRRGEAAADLDAVRARLDRLNGELLDALGQGLNDAARADCATQARRARERAARRRRLDELHRIALSRALGDLCRRAP